MPLHQWVIIGQLPAALLDLNKLLVLCEALEMQQEGAPPGGRQAAVVLALCRKEGRR